MNLRSGSWYVRLFHACLYVWASFKYFDEWDREKFTERHAKQTNLCFFVRTIVVWTPLVLVLHVAVYGAAVTVLAVAPIYLFGVGGYGKTLLVLAIVAATIAGVVALIRWAESRPRKPEPMQVGVSATDVVLEWLAAKKAKICPTITFVGGR